MRRLPRYRATSGAQRTPVPFGHTAANLASGGVCGTVRLLHRDLLVKTVHRRRPVSSVLSLEPMLGEQQAA